MRERLAAQGTADRLEAGDSSIHTVRTSTNSNYDETLSRPFFFILAILAIPALLVSDCLHQLRFSARHQQMGALPLILIGLSYIF